MARVLIADDEPYMLRLVGHVLHQAGHSVHTCTDGWEAFEAAARLSPDVFVCDLAMPGMDGLSLVRALRSNPATAALPILILTAHGQEAHRKSGFEAGASGFLSKPFTVDALVGAVLDLLAKSEEQLDREHSGG